MSLVPPSNDSILKASHEALDALYILSATDQSASSSEQRSRDQLTYDDEIGRLQIWIGEHDVLSGKLDHKLREASDLSALVVELLEDLQDLAADHSSTGPSFPSSPVNEKTTSPSTTTTKATNTHLSPSVHKLIFDDGKSARSDPLSLDTSILSLDSRSDSPLRRVHYVVDRLFELGPTLLDPTPHDRIEQPAHSDAAQLDIGHVKERFPRANQNLIERLGRANWERRQALREARQQNEDYPHQGQQLDSSGLFETELDADPDGSAGSIADTDTSISSASNDSTPPSLGDFSVPANQSVTATTSVGIRSQLSNLDIKSTATEILRNDENVPQSAPCVNIHYKVPLPPDGLNGSPFTCPFCFYTISDMTKMSDWREHVFADLQPFMCTYPTCRSSNKTYGSRRAWWKHETECHRVQHSWNCPPCEQQQLESQYDTSASFEDHMKVHHPLLTSTQIQNIRDVCRIDIKKHSPDEVCPLCLETVRIKGKISTRALERAVRRHVSDHLEQITYFVAFPAGQMLIKEDDSDFQDDSDSEYGLQSEIRSIKSKDPLLSKKEIQVVNVNTFLAEQWRAAGFDPATAELPKGILIAKEQNRVGASDENANQAKVKGATVAPNFPVFTMVPPPNEHFYFRQSLLTDAGKILQSPGSICIFHGVGGVGKTLAAIEYIHTNKSHYDAVFWIQADTAPGLADSCLQMLMALGIVSSTEDHYQVFDKGRNWLQETGCRWLIVFDNTIRWADISRLMPNMFQHTNGSVLITTQIDNLLPAGGNVTQMRLDPLDPPAGASMLLKYLDRDPLTDPERYLAMEVATFVRGIPVAVAHAAGYVSYSQLSLEDLIDIFREWRKRVGVATDEADDLPAIFLQASLSYDEMLDMVWEVTLRELSQDARDVLNVLAHLNPTNVPQNMLWGIHEDKSLQFLDKRERVRMKRINDSLIRRRLVTKDGDSAFSMHRSLQRGIRTMLSQDKNQHQIVFNQAVALVREMFPRSNTLQQPSPDKWSECQKLLPHLYALHDVYRDFAPNIAGSVEFAQLLLDAGMDQFEQGIIHEGLPLLKTAESVIYEGIGFTEEHDMMKADIHAMIAIMYDNTGVEHREESLMRRKSALDIRKRKFEAAQKPGRNDEILLYNSWMEYAISLLHYHRYDEAEPIIEKCKTKFEEWGPEGEIPFEYAKYYNKIALVRMYQGRFDEAASDAAHSVELMAKAGYSLFASRVKFDLACIILQSGDTERSLHLHREIYEQRLATVGPTNELTLHSAYAIGAIYEQEGNLSEAKLWYLKILDQRRSLTPWPEGAYARVQFHLASVLLAQDGGENDVEQANDLREKARKVLHRLAPLDVPPQLKGVTDEAVLFDHIQPISPGGPRFTGRDLLRYFMPSR